MSLKRILLVSIWGGLCGVPAALTCLADSPLSTVSLVASVDSVVPGQNFTLGLQFDMQDGWHTYAEDPGDSGMPPDITVLSPQGLRFGRWRFPPAQTFTDAAGTTYGYAGRVVLLGTVHVPSPVEDGTTVVIEMDVTWLVCQDACIPLSSTLRLELPVRASDGGKANTRWQLLLKEGGWAASHN